MKRCYDMKIMDGRERNDSIVGWNRDSNEPPSNCSYQAVLHL